MYWPLSLSLSLSLSLNISTGHYLSPPPLSLSIYPLAIVFLSSPSLSIYLLVIVFLPKCGVMEAELKISFDNRKNKK